MSKDSPTRTYRLVDGQPVPSSLREMWSEDIEERQIGYHQIGDVEISTVFLGLDHNWIGAGPPLLFETAVRHGMTHYDVVQRYATREQASLGHKRWVEQEELRAAQANPTRIVH